MSALQHSLVRRRRHHKKSTLRGRQLAAFALSGRRFGALSTVRVVEHLGRNHVLCRCDCGAEKPYARHDLERGRVVSCGCQQAARAQVNGLKNRRHGHSAMGRRSSTYTAWTNMLQRCENPDHQDYGRYGGRGIRVCGKWHTFDQFLADMGDRPTGLTLDRENNGGDYEPGNCRWATPRTQQNNRRTNRMITFRGRTLTMSEWAREAGINPITFRARIYSGVPMERALNPAPIPKPGRPKRAVA